MWSWSDTDNERKIYVDAAREFVLQRDWQIGIDKLDEVLENL